MAAHRLPGDMGGAFPTVLRHRGGVVREGCREAQGYYFCPPVSHEVFMSVLMRGMASRTSDLNFIVQSMV